MKKDTLIQIILGTIGGLIASIGMCMCLVEEWNMLKPGVVVCIVGVIILLCMIPVYRKSHPVKRKGFNGGLIATVVIGIIGALVMGTGMSLCLVENQETAKMILGLIVGVVGLLVCVLNYPIYAYLKNNK